MLLHLLVLLLIAAFPQIFQAPRTLWVEPEAQRPPIKFTFMDLIDDSVVEDNPDAQLISDKNREESGDTPRVTTPEGKDPPSTGNTSERIDGGTEPVPLPERARDVVALPRLAPARRPAPPPAPADQPATPELPTAVSEPVAEPSPEPPLEAPADRTEAAVDPPRGRTAPPRPAPGGIEQGTETGRPQRRRETPQSRFAQALEDLHTPLPMDLQALTPPDSPSADASSSGRSTRWQFDNPSPAYPVKVGHLSFDSKGADFGPWLAEFHRRVLSEWHRNLDAWRREIWSNIAASRFIPDQEKQMRYAFQMNRIRGVTGIDFVVTREGSVVSLEVVHRSGIDGLDRSVQRTLRNVMLPPLPEDYPDDTLPIRAGFYYNVRPPD